MKTKKDAKSKQGNGVDMDRAWRKYLDDNPERHKSLVKLLNPKKRAPVDVRREPKIGFRLPASD